MRRCHVQARKGIQVAVRVGETAANDAGVRVSRSRDSLADALTRVAVWVTERDGVGAHPLGEQSTAVPHLVFDINLREHVERAVHMRVTADLDQIAWERRDLRPGERPVVLSR
jgi:hypothetical protein